MIQIEFFPASNGDSIFLSIKNEKFILIDGGFAQTYSKHIKKKLALLNHQKKFLDLIVITHIDNDHINGILKLFGDEYIDLVKKVWFNSGEILSKYFSIENENQKIDIIATQKDSEIIGVKNGIKLENILNKLNISNIKPIQTEQTLVLDRNISFILLSPDENKLSLLNKEWNKILKEELKKDTSISIGANLNDYDKTIEELINIPFNPDNSIANGSSIAFIFQYSSLSFLFLADAHIDVIVKSLKDLEYSSMNPLKVKFVKLSHHGSKKNLTEEFLSLIDTDTYIISTKGSPVHNHPNKETLAKIISMHQTKGQACRFIFNYPNEGQLRNIFKELNFEQIDDTFFNIEYNEKYNFYLQFPKTSNSGAILNYEI